MTEKKIIAELDSILNNVIEDARRLNTPIAKNRDEIIIGQYSIKRTNGYFVVVDRKKPKLVVDELLLINSAFIIAKSLKRGDTRRINRVLEYEKYYSKHKTDMIFYANSFKHALANREYRKTEIIQYRYEIARDKAHELKRKIRDMDKFVQKR